MKKTLITLLALGCCAMGTTFPEVLCDVQDTRVENSTSTTLSGYESNAITVAVTLNVSNLRQISDTEFAGSSEAVRFWELGGTWDTGATGKIAAANNGSSGSDYTSVYMGATIDAYGDKGAMSGNTGALNFPNDNKIFTASTNWDTIKAITLVFSYDGSSETANSELNASVCILNSDGTTSVLSSSNRPVISSSYTEKDFYATNISVSATYVDSYTVYGGSMTLAQVEAVSKARVIPEPATATLSLLALCGLAARRRRH